MSWYISDLPKIDTEQYSSITEFRNSRIDWGEFEGEKKYLLAIAEVLSERWEKAKLMLDYSKLDEFDLQGYTFLWFRRYMPEVLDLNPWFLPDLLKVIQYRSTDKMKKKAIWYDFLHFNVAFENDRGLTTSIVNADHHSIQTRGFVQKTLFWCYDQDKYSALELAKTLNESIQSKIIINNEFDLLMLIYGVPECRMLINEIVASSWEKPENPIDSELKEFITGRINKIKRANPINAILNEVMGQVISILIDAAFKFSTYDIYQRVIFNHSCLLSGFMDRFDKDVMNKNYYVLERSFSGDISFRGENY